MHGNVQCVISQKIVIGEKQKLKNVRHNNVGDRIKGKYLTTIKLLSGQWKYFDFDDGIDRFKTTTKLILGNLRFLYKYYKTSFKRT